MLTLIKNLFKTDLANIKRNQFNTLLRNANFIHNNYYDLAEIESTLPNNKRVSFTYENREYHSLASIYTSDGGHLNEPGRLKTAFYLLKKLVDISLK